MKATQVIELKPFSSLNYILSIYFFIDYTVYRLERSPISVNNYETITILILEILEMSVALSWLLNNSLSVIYYANNA